MDELIKKENSIFEILQDFTNSNLKFIAIGGYAVSSFKHRFSIDADIVVKSSDLEIFEKILKKKGLKKTISKELGNIYSSKFIRYEKDTASIDLLIDASASKQTNAAFSFDFLLKNSKKRKIIGIEKEITALVPKKEILIITKIHAGRLTDFRDIAALAKDSDVELIKKYLFKGNIEVVKRNLKKLNETVNNPDFIDSFKGVFIEKKFDVDLEKVKEISNLKET